MRAVMEAPIERKHSAGHALLAMGGTALFLELWALWLEAGVRWSHGAAESLGWIGALGIAMLEMVDFIAWNPNGILLSLTRVLLLCWPVAVMVAGVAVSRKAA
jgi:hypothetical protein